MNHRIIIFIILIFFTACNSDLKTELDLHTISFPPKLAVSATLDGESGIFTLFLSEGNALADYAKPRSPDKEIIRDGEIRLFEDNTLIFSEPGPFDLSFIDHHLEQDENGVYYAVQVRHGYSFEKNGVSTRPGSVYRLEIEVEGYKPVTSSMTMPATPVVSASMDTTIHVNVLYHDTKSYNMRSGFYRALYYNPSGIYYNYENTWPVTVHFTDPDPTERDYFVLEIKRSQRAVNYDSKYDTSSSFGIGVSDIAILQDNPNIEAAEGKPSDFNYAIYYAFHSLVMSDISFSGKNASLTFYSAVERTTPYPYPPSLTEDPELVKILFHHTTTLNVKHISTETFKYFRSQLMQEAGVGFYTEPVVIAGNIENGYGFFSVFNSVSFQFLEYVTEEYYRR